VLRDELRRAIDANKKQMTVTEVSFDDDLKKGRDDDDVADGGEAEE